MKVGGASGAAPAVAAGGRRSESAQGFAPLGEGAAVAAASGPSATASVQGLDALLMLQEPEDSMTRRRRAVRRADGLLDRLDALKLSLMGEGEPQAALQRLAQAVRERRAAVDEDARLSEVLDAVETRAAVELAKHQVAQAAGQAAGATGSGR